MVKGNITKNKRPTQKKVANYDTKIIVIAAVAVVLVAAIICGICVLDAYKRSYVGKVDGKKISYSMYKMFLEDVKSEMEEDMGEDEESADFWTTEKQKEAEEKAIEEVTLWMGEYDVACNEGYGITDESKEEVIDNFESYLSYYYQMYSSYYSSQEEFLTAFLGDMDIDDYEDYLVKNDCIQRYRDALEEGYEPTEERIQEKYEEGIDTYRSVNMVTLAFAKSTKPTEVTEPTEPDGYADLTDEEKENTENQTYIDYEADLQEYNEYLAELETYESESEALGTKVQAMFDVLLENGTYTGSGINEVTVTNDDDTTTTVINEYTDATLEEIAEGESSLYQSDKGEASFTKAAASETSTLEQFAVSLDWTDDTRAAVQSSSEEESYAVESVQNEDGTFKETVIKLLEDDNYFYITKCVGIDDLNTVADDVEDSETTSVRDTVIADVKEDMSEEELEQKVADAGDKYTFKLNRQSVIDSIKEVVFATDEE